LIYAVENILNMIWLILFMLSRKKEIQQWLTKLKQTTKPIIVEGPKDKQALSPYTNASIFTLSKKPLFVVVEDIAQIHPDVILLTDFDKKGKELYGKLSKHLRKQGVKIDTYFREFLQKNTKLSHVEGLNTYLQNYIND
jgi:5S rRNA maturation endonuclease (ribonuclease M5)